MILNCPKCSTRFLIDPNHLGTTGRNVRCGACSHEWHQDPEKPAARNYAPPSLNLDDVVTEPLENTDDRAAADAAGEKPKKQKKKRDREGRRRLWPRLIAWFLFVFVILAILAGGYFERGEIVSRWPASAKIYKALGIPYTPAKNVGLVVPEGSVRISRSNIGDIPTLIIEGDIENRAKLPQRVSEMRITLVDKEGKTLKTWTFAPETRLLRPGGSMSFRTSVSRPPPDAVKVTFSFDLAKKTAE